MSVAAPGGADGEHVAVTEEGDSHGAGVAANRPTAVPAENGTALRKADDAMAEPPGRGAAIVMYLVCIAIPIGFILGPLAAFIIWRVRRDEPFLDFHGRQVLDIVLTAILVGGGLYLVGRLVEQVWPLVGIAVQWTALGVVVVQFLLLLWGAVAAARAEDRALPASLGILRRRTAV